MPTCSADGVEPTTEEKVEVSRSKGAMVRRYMCSLRHRRLRSALCTTVYIDLMLLLLAGWGVCSRNSGGATGTSPRWQLHHREAQRGRPRPHRRPQRPSARPSGRCESANRRSRRMDRIPGRSTWSALGPATNRTDLFPVFIFGRHHKSARTSSHGVCIRMDQSTRWGAVIKGMLVNSVPIGSYHTYGLGYEPG